MHTVSNPCARRAATAAAAAGAGGNGFAVVGSKATPLWANALRWQSSDSGVKNDPRWMNRPSEATYRRPKDSPKEKGTKATSFSVDRSRLYDISKDPFANLKEFTLNPKKEQPSPLTKDIGSMIQIRGPMTVHDYMALALHHSQHGYYHSAPEKIGEQGDFITAPELSQTFGEMIGLWMYSTFLAMGKPPQIRLIELGPGKGTLMQDIVRVVRRFPDFQRALHIHLVEASQAMRQRQYAALLGDNVPRVDKVDDGVQHTTPDGIPVSWSVYFDQTPKDLPVLVIGQEFLDAFPVHQFVYTKDGWREKLIDLDPSDAPQHFRVVLAQGQTHAARQFLDPQRGLIHPGATYREGQMLEVCPLAISTCAAVARRVCTTGGAALFVDYGQDGPSEDSIRAFKKHTQVPFLSTPGQVDLTVDIDFAQCRRVVQAEGATALPLQTQGRFLMALGIVPRIQQLIAPDEVSEDDAERMVNAVKMLISPEQMGEKFKVFGIAHPSLSSALCGFDTHTTHTAQAAPDATQT